jgi:protein TonB
MTPVFALWFALFAAQATTPATPPPSEPPAVQAAQPQSQATPTTPAPGHTAPTKPPCRNPDASGNYHVGCGVTPPRLTYQPEPQYAEIARQQKINGIVTLSFLVDALGNPENVHVIKSIADTVDPKQRAAALSLDQAAVDAVKKYKFKPAMKDGKPVPIYLNVEVNFQDY